MRILIRTSSLGVLFLLVVLAVIIASAEAAGAHPLGNFSVNQLEAITLHPDRVTVAAAVDVAELPTLQDKSTVDRDGDGAASPAERAAFAATSCRALASGFTVRVDGSRLNWTVKPGAYVYVPGSAGLSTSRLDCQLSADAALGRAASVEVSNSYRTDRVGWREITAAGQGVHLVSSPLPTKDVSDGLRAYPKDLLSSPLDVRSARLSVRPGSGGGSSVRAPTVSDGSVFARWTARADEALRSLLGSRHLTPAVGLLAVLLALGLGAGHAALPGHGKTVMAAYLAGRRGRRRDALVVGATVTLTHTGGVLAVGLLLTAVASLAGETVLGYLGVASGALVATVGLGMLLDLRRRGGAGHSHSHDGHGHGHGHSHPHDDGHSHDHTDAHDHVDEPEPVYALAVAHTDGEHEHAPHQHEPAAVGHSHEHPAEVDHPHEQPAELGHSHSHGPHRHPHDRPSRLGLIGVGIAGGLVPSPSALVILLGAIGLGRTAFGVLLVVGYGVGMAGALTAAGLALIVLQDRWDRRQRAFPLLSRLTARWSTAAPVLTAGVVVLVGLGLAARALLTL